MNMSDISGDFLLAVAALLGGLVSAALCDRCIISAETGEPLCSKVHCASCGRELVFWDRGPLLSWLLNGGKCRFCGAVISKREPLLSFLTIALWPVSLQIWLPRDAAAALLIMVSGTCLLCASGLCWINASERPILLPFLLCMGIMSLILPDGLSLVSHVFGALGMFLFCLLLRLLPPWLRGPERLRRDTIVYMACTGLIIGWQACFVILPTAVILGFVFSLVGRKKQRSLNQGPQTDVKRTGIRPGRSTPSLWLTGGAVIALGIGRLIMNRYLALFSGIG